jgi:hypothetical protein
LNAPVSALVRDGQGNLYASGEFTQAGGQAARHIARWDGATWNALGDGFAAAVHLTIGNGDALYAYWSETDGLGNWVAHVAQWNGAAWQSFTAGPRELCNYYGCEMVVDHQGHLYTSALDVPVALWDGATWVTLGKEMFAGYFYVDGQDRLYIARQSGGPLLYGIYWWDGAGWQEVGDFIPGNDPQNGWVSAMLEVTPGGAKADMLYVIATGQNQVADAQSLYAWDGATWREITALHNSMGYVSSLALDSRGNLYLGGSFTVLGGMPAGHLAVWRIE